MNNDAFRALINKQRQESTAEKSTKEIAREAVENEFQKKRSRLGGGKRGRGGFHQGYGSDSDGASSDDGLDNDKTKKLGHEKDTKEEDDEPEWKRRRREKKLLQEGGNEYRDRAKERREGRNVDYKSLEGMAAQSSEDDRRRQAELSKYLGGDIEHTHLVKGLDKALASKVRREEMVQGGERSQYDGGDLDQLFEDSYAQKKEQLSSKKIATDWRTSKPKTELGRNVMAYLLQKQSSATLATSASTMASTQIKTNPTIQKSIQRSVLTFSLDSDVRQRKKAWEVPKISIKAFTDNDSTIRRKMTPLNQHLISTISKKLNGGSRKDKGTSKYINDMNGQDNSEKDTANSTQADKKSKTAANGSSTKEDDDDSEDDIFANVGSYEGLAPKISSYSAADKSFDGTKEKDNSDSIQDTSIAKQSKKSIFDNLVSEAEPAVPIRVQKQSLVQPIRQQQNKNVIDRDILGGKQENDVSYQKRRGPSAKNEGISMNSYSTGYGEDIDVDFANDDEWQGKHKDDKGEKDKTSRDIVEDQELGDENV